MNHLTSIEEATPSTTNQLLTRGDRILLSWPGIATNRSPPFQTVWGCGSVISGQLLALVSSTDDLAHRLIVKHILKYGKLDSKRIDISQVGLVLDTVDCFYPGTTVKEAVDMVCKLTKTRAEERDRYLLALGLCPNDSLGSKDRLMSERETRVKLRIVQQALSCPKVLILVDAMHDLDDLSVHKILKALKHVGENATCLIVAQSRLDVTCFELVNTVLILDAEDQRSLFGEPRLVADMVNIDDDGFLSANESNQRPQSITSIANNTSTGDTFDNQSVQLDMPLRRVNMAIQFWCLLAREWRSIFRNVKSLVIRLTVTLLSSILFAFIFFESPDDSFLALRNKIGILSYITTFWIVYVVNTLPEHFDLVVPMIREERRRRLYFWPLALIAIYVSEFPLLILQVIIFSFIVYYVEQLLSTGTVVNTIIFMTTLCIQAGTNLSLAIMLACLSDDPEIVRASRAVAVLLAYLFGGFLAAPKTVTWILRWMQYLNPIYYAYRLLVWNEFENQRSDPAVQMFLNEYGISPVGSTVWIGWGCLLGLTAFFGFIALIGAHFNTRSHRILQALSRKASRPPFYKEKS